MLKDELLDAWVQLSVAVVNERVVSELTYNESMVCHILFQNQENGTQEKLTATDLCEHLHMQKSQMNRTLNTLEKKGQIIRERSGKDRRQVFVWLDLDHADLFFQQHQRILDLIDEIANRIGEEKGHEIAEIFHLVSETVEEII